MRVKKCDFALIDAFASKPLTGNPCAVVIGANKLSTEQMLSIAKEMNQSETAFLMESKISDIRARYFTPEAEIPLAGHPTIATVHAAIEFGWIKKKGKKQTLSLELNDGPIQVEVEGSLIRMFQRKPIFGEFHDPKQVCELFGLSDSDLLPGAKIQTVSTGTRQLMVPIKSHASLKKLSMNVEGYKTYRAQKGFFSPHFFCLGGISKGAATFARHIGVSPDTPEDAFTGSATGGMAVYLWKHGLIKSPKFIAEQGHWMGRPGSAQVEVFGPRDNIETVSVAGSAFTVVRGKITI